MVYFTTLLLSMFITIGLIPILSKIALRLNFVDMPNERKVHSAPIPRVGGMAMAVGLFFALLLQGNMDRAVLSIFIGSVIIVVFGVIDDTVGLGVRVKFLGQILAALVLIFYGSLTINDLGECLPTACLLPYYLAFPLTLLTIVAVTNAVNLADGLDGLAGGIMLQSFMCLFALGVQGGNIFVATISIGAIGAILGFLRFNTHPARIFMGDTGSQMLGFLAIALALLLTQRNQALSPLIPLLLLGFPILDTVVVMLERNRGGMSPFTADKNHFHHKLLKTGFFHTETVFIVYSIQALFIISAYLLRYYSEWQIIGSFWGLVVILIVPFYLAADRGVYLRRASVLDTVVKKALRINLKESSLFFKVSQLSLEYGIAAIFLYSTFIPHAIPPWYGLITASLLLLIFADRMYKLQRCVAIIRVTCYVVMPLILFQSMSHVAVFITPLVMKSYIAIFVYLTLVTLLILKYTRRRKGFRPTTTDYLIVLIAVALSQSPLHSAVNASIIFWGTCQMVFLFSVEVALGEVREKVDRVCYFMVPALCVVTYRAAENYLLNNNPQLLP